MTNEKYNRRNVFQNESKQCALHALKLFFYQKAKNGMHALRNICSIYVKIAEAKNAEVDC